MGYLRLKSMRAAFLLLALVLIVWTGSPGLTTSANSLTGKSDRGSLMAHQEKPRVRAPELKGGRGWLNTDKPLTLEALKGKVVLLDFWTYGCINCIHII